MINPNNKQFLTLNQAIYKQPTQITLQDIINTNFNNGIIVNFEPQNVQNTNNKIIEIDTKENCSSSSDSTYSTNLVHSDNVNDEKSFNDDKINNNDSNTNSVVSSISDYSSNYEIESENESEKSEITETKLYWQYGNSGLKIINFNKLMSRNLSIMFYIDKLFIEYLTLNNSNNYDNLFNNNTNKKYELNTGTINSSNGNVSVYINHEKLKGKFNVLSANFISFSNIEITQKELKKNSIPNLNSLLKHKENLFHIAKIIKILSLTNKIKIKYNLSNTNVNINDISKNANNYLEKLITNNNKNKILKSNKHSAFYIKIYNDKGKSFYIDEKKNIIHYMATDINFDNYTVNLRYYTFNILNGKIEKI